MDSWARPPSICRFNAHINAEDWLSLTNPGTDKYLATVEAERGYIDLNVVNQI
jgi:hypothetical protein